MKPEFRNPKLELLFIALLALLPRGLDLQQFVTADEAKWVYRSAQFLLALLQGDWAGTAVNLTPAVTTTWLGSLGLVAYHTLHQTALGTPLTEWLAAIPPYRIIDLGALAATRWMMVAASVIAVTGIFLMARRLWGSMVAMPVGLLLALDPQLIGLTRILGHDAPAGLFSLLALLALFGALQNGNLSRKYLLVAGIFAGGAFLSKSPTLFLLPFAALMLVLRTGGRRGLQGFVIWGMTAYVTFVLFWPAAWIAPLQQPFAVLENGFFSATSLDETPEPADTATGIDLLYYPLNGGFKLSLPLTLGLIIGVGLLWQHRRRLRHLNWRHNDWFWLGLFALGFVAMMTLGDKRSYRYILPASLSLTVLGAMAYSRIRQPQALHLWGTLAVGGALLLLPYAPYYFNYYNPLLGGPLTAPKLVKIGWGEGMNQVGDWLSNQPNAAAHTVGAAYASTLTPYFAGPVRNPDDAGLDYIVDYIKQRDPASMTQTYYRDQLSPLHQLYLTSVNYANIYPGPAVQTPLDKGAISAFRPERDHLPLGQAWRIDLLGEPRPAQANFSLHTEGGVVWEDDLNGVSLSDTTSAYTLTLPVNLPPAALTLKVAGQTMATLPAVFVTLPSDFTPTPTDFGGDIELAGFKVERTDEQVTVWLAWQTPNAPTTDYTLFVHLLDENNERLTGFDAPPDPPTSTWRPGRLIIARYPLTLPTDQTGPFGLRAGVYNTQTGAAPARPTLLPIQLNSE